MNPLKARVHNGRLVLDAPSDLPEGEVVYLQPVDAVLEGEFDDTVTGAELQYIQANWARFQGLVTFIKWRRDGGGAMVTATPLIGLSSLGGDLTVTYDEKGVGGWCHVHLIAPGASRPLGAERLKYIVGHLSSFLADTSDSRRWVLSLSERHTSVYGEHVGARAIFHLQDADAKMFAKLVLTEAGRKQWLETLSQHSGA